MTETTLDHDAPENVVVPATLADAPALGALAEEGGFVLDLAEELERSYVRVGVVRRGAAVLGYLLAQFVADEVELLQLVVARQARRQGLGGALLDDLLREARARAARAVHLEVRASNAPALALYRGRGFVEEGLRRGYYDDGEDALLLSCWLV